MTQEMKSTETKVLELTDEELRTVTGGRKAGAEQHEYLIVKMTDAIVTGVTL